MKNSPLKLVELDKLDPELERETSVSLVDDLHSSDSDEVEGLWLVSYADMMTLLFGFFVMISVFSSPDPKKIEKLKEQTAKTMGIEYKNPYQDLAHTMKSIVEDLKVGQAVSVTETTEGIEIASNGTLFFDSASSVLSSEAQGLLIQVADVLARQTKGLRIIVEGHTDSVPVHTPLYPSNWELSSARASTVVRLFESRGLQHADLRPVGFADTEPVSDDHNLNRRIVIRIQNKIK